jgi:hypothetical protein
LQSLRILEQNQEKVAVSQKKKEAKKQELEAKKVSEAIAAATLEFYILSIAIGVANII